MWYGGQQENTSSTNNVDNLPRKSSRLFSHVAESCSNKHQHQHVNPKDFNDEDNKTGLSEIDLTEKDGDHTLKEKVSQTQINTWCRELLHSILFAWNGNEFFGQLIKLLPYQLRRILSQTISFSDNPRTIVEREILWKRTVTIKQTAS